MNIEEYILEIKRQLKAQGYKGKKVDYKEFRKLYEKYGNKMSEKEFAENILELTYYQYYELKRNIYKVVILKKLLKETIKQDVETIKNKLEIDGYSGKLIDYAELKRLHQKYGSQMPEDTFAKYVLDLKDTSYIQVKSGRRKVFILKNLHDKEFAGKADEIEKIKQILKQQGYIGRLINYTELQNIHLQYGNQLPEYKFAREVLEISASLYGNLKRTERKKARVLKSLKIEPTQEEIQRIQELLETKGIAGMLIDYSELQRLHQEYGMQMEEDVFAKHILEIPCYTYLDMKDGKYKTQILCHNKKVELIHSMLLNESRWYTKEELETICQQNGISIDKIIRQIISNGTDLYNEIYKKVLEEKGKLWIGRTALSEEFFEKNIDTIMKLAEIALIIAKRTYNLSYNSNDDDIIQDCIIWLLQNAGEIEKNFIDYPHIMERKLFNTIKKGIIIRIFMTFEEKIKTVSFQQKFKLRKGNKNDLESRIPSEYNLEKDVLDNVDFERTADIAKKCVKAMREQLEAGQSKQSILSSVQEMFRLSKEELLDIMKNYLNSKSKLHDFEEEK